MIQITDARLPGEWLNTVRFDDLSDVAWRVFTSSLMWSAENGTDGHIPARYLRLLHPDGEQPQAHAEILAANLWVQESGGYFMPEWEGSFHQSTALQVQTYKAGAAKRSSAYRERQRQKLANAVGFDPSSPPPVTRDDARDVTSGNTRDVGKAKAKAKAKQALDGGTNPDEKITPADGLPDATVSPVMDWPTVAIPGAADLCRVAECGQPLTAPTSRAAGICAKRDAAHRGAAVPTRGEAA